MNEVKVWRFILAGALAACVAACGKPTTPGPDAGEPEATVDAGTPEDAGTADAGIPGPQVTAQDSRGAFAPSPTRAILVGTKLALFGTQDAALSPVWFGRPVTPDSWDGWFRAGLIALDTTTGAAHVYTEADGLPLAHLAENPVDYGNQTAPIFSLAWIEKDRSFAAAGWDFVINGTVGDDGTISFQSTRLKAVGAASFAHVAQVAVLGDELFVGTDQGVAVLDASSLALLRWVDFGSVVSGAVWVGPMSAGTVDGRAMMGMVVGPAAKPWFSHVALVEAGQTQAQVFAFTDGSKPTTVLGMNGMMLVGARTSDARGAIYAIGGAVDGLAMDVMVSADALSSSWYGPLVPSTMLWEPSRQSLVVGGSLYTTDDGGLVELAGSEDGTISGAPMTLLPPEDPYFQLLPLQVNALALDDQGRLYLAGRQVCDETRLRTLPVFRLERQDKGTSKLVRPYLSGVQQLVTDPNGDLWLSVSDGDPGMACVGGAIGNGLCRLRADGACELVPLTINSGSRLIPVAPQVKALAFGRADRQEMAAATRGDLVWQQTGPVASVIDTAGDPRLSLRLTSAAYSEDGALWLGSQMEWALENDPTIDENALNARGPHGLGLVEHDDTGAITFTRRYVRVLSDLGIEEIAGMPSDTVWAVQPLPGHRRVIAALGKDRTAAPVDRSLGELAPVDSHGGLVLIDDQTVTPFAAPEGTSFGEVTALTQTADGVLYALDDTLGVLKLDVAAKTVSVWAPPVWRATERTLSLAMDGAGHAAVGTSQGLYLIGADGGVTHVFDQQAWGYVWAVRFMGDGVLYAGTDNGLVRLAIGEATLPESLGAASFSDRTIWPLPPPCGGGQDCACQSNKDCLGGWYCNANDSTCAQKQACDKDCSCPTVNGCSDGLTCQSGFAGQSCI